MSKKQERQTGGAPKVVELMNGATEQTSYDTESLDKFLSMLFGHELEDNEYILTWAVKTEFGLPTVDGDLLNALELETEHRSLYVSSATASEDLGDGLYYNRDDLFYGMCVLTIDVKPNTVMPKELQPTYIISIGKDKQYGYVLSEPIYDYDVACAFLHALSEHDLFKTKYPLPQKVIRLPAGIRGGEGKKRFDAVELEFCEGPIWEPEKILEVLELNIKWSELSESPLRAIKEFRGAGVGSAPFCQTRPRIMSLDGLIDPALEWLFENKMVKQHINDFFTIICPWSDTHKAGNENAQYWPIGNNGISRKFRCHDQNCSSHDTRAFLRTIVSMGGPPEGVFDKTPNLLRDYVFDFSGNSVWKITDDGVPKIFSMAAFKNAHPYNVETYGPKGKKIAVPIVKHWMNSPYRVVVEGRIFDPSTKARIVRGYENELLVNRFCVPDWNEGEYDKEEVEQFLEFIKYLIPHKVERDYFLNWLACKAQNMGFRGIAIIMVAKQQGTGRNTLADMLSQLFGPANLEHVPFDRMIGEAKYDEWKESPIIVTDETLSSAGGTTFKMAYERLKELIDPRPKPVRINPKYGKQRISTIHSSFLFMSNHENAISMTEADRRFYVITNALKPASPEYFGHLNKWLNVLDENKKPAWAKHVWRWLLERKTNIDIMLSPPVSTAGKKRMLQSSKSKLELAVEGFLSETESIYITTHILQRMVMELRKTIGFRRKKDIERDLNIMLRERTIEAGNGVQMRMDGTVVRPRIILDKVSADEAEDLSRMIMSPNERKEMRNNIRLTTEKKEWDRIREQVKKYIEENVY